MFLSHIHNMKCCCNPEFEYRISLEKSLRDASVWAELNTDRPKEEIDKSFEQGIIKINKMFEPLFIEPN